MPKYRYGWIEISHNLFELDFLLLSVYAVYSILQSLRCAAYVPTITAAHVLVNDHTLLLGRHDIFADRWKHLSGMVVYRKMSSFYFFYYYYLPFLSSIHEKANCIAIFWTGSPHSLGSCLF